MKSIQRKFNKEVKDNPSLSSLICFVRSIKGKNYTQRSIAEWFTELVDWDDYKGSSKTQLLRWLKTI